MIHEVFQISAGLIRDIGGQRTYTLETIANAVSAYSPIDKIFYVGYDVPSTNPIWGQFRKYGKRPTAYSNEETIVEIKYANHLSDEWRRFVVCKELCHAIDDDEGAHSISDKSIERLVANFSLISLRRTIRHDGNNRAFNAEMAAEIGAIELLCPLSERPQLIASNGGDIEKLCNDFQIPLDYSFAFTRDFMDFMSS